MTDIKTVPTKEACALAGVSRQTLYNRTKPVIAGHGRTPSQWSIADLERIKASKKSATPGRGATKSRIAEFVDQLAGGDA